MKYKFKLPLFLCAGFMAFSSISANALVEENNLDTFIAACKLDDVDCVAHLLKDGASIFSLDKEGRTALHIAAKIGSIKVFNYIFESVRAVPAIINSRDFNRKTALYMAVSKGHCKIVESLLQSNVIELDELDNNENNILEVAILNGYEDIVKVLIRNGEKYDYLNKNPTKLLNLAQKKRYMNIVKLLTEQVCFSKTQLENVVWCAARDGNCDTLKYLIEECKVDINYAYQNGQTALCIAVSKGYKGVVKYLVEECKVDVNQVDNEGRTPLICAAANGHKDVVKYLVEECGDNVDQVDNKGRTPLIVAANGHKDVVKYLVEECGDNVDQVDNKGRTPLIVAANGHKDVVKYLVEECGDNVNQVDNKGRTPLIVAAIGDHQNIAEYLIEECPVNINQVDNKGRTAFNNAMYFSSEDVVKYMVDNCEVDPREEVKGVDSPLYNAIEEIRNDMLVYLTEHDYADHDELIKYGSEFLIKSIEEGDILKVDQLTTFIDFPDSFIRSCLDKMINEYDIDGPRYKEMDYLFESSLNQPPKEENVVSNEHLHYACDAGDIEAVIDILNDKKNNKVDINSLCLRNGRSALHLAASKGHFEIVEELLDDIDININDTDIYGYTALHLAFLNGHVDIANLILSDDGVDISKTNKENKTIFHCAAKFGDATTFELLSKRYDYYKTNLLLLEVDPIIHINSVMYKNGKTPLHVAVARHNKGAVKWLLGLDDIDVNIVSRFEGTALCIAVRGIAQSTSKRVDYNTVNQNNLEIAELLLEREDIDVNKGANVLGSVLQSAARYKKINLIDKILSFPEIRFDVSDSIEGSQLLSNIGRTPISEALLRGNGHTARKLLKRMGIINEDCDLRGLTQLHMACLENDIKTISKILETNDYDINVIDFYGNTPLHLAVKSGAFEAMVLLLCQQGIDVNQKDAMNMDVLEIMVRNGNNRMVNAFVLHSVTGSSDLSFESNPLEPFLSEDFVEIFLTERVKSQQKLSLCSYMRIEFSNYQINGETARMLLNDQSIEKDSEIEELLHNLDSN